MSKPFAGATVDGLVRVIQLCRKDASLRWHPCSTPEATIYLDVSPNYHFHIDLHKPVELNYTQYSLCGAVAILTVKHAGSKSHPVVGCISNTDINTKVIPPCLDGTDVLFHLGDNVWAEQCFWKQDLDMLAELYLATWAQLPMSDMEHRLIPDDTDFGLHPGFKRHEGLDFSAMVRFTDILVWAINGVKRQPHHYYTAHFDTPHTRYLAVSNWVPDAKDQPRFVDNTELVEDLLIQHPNMAKRVVLMLSRCTFAITQTLTLHRLILNDTYRRNASSYLAFAKLKRQWGTDLTIVCGDIALPIAFQVIVEHDNRITSYPMYATGSFSCHIEAHAPSDFELSKVVGVRLRQLPHCHHLEAGHSYLRFIMHKPHMVYADHDPMHSISVLTKYLINGAI